MLGVVAILFVSLVVLLVLFSSSADGETIYLAKYDLPESYTSLDNDLPALCGDLTVPGYYYRAAIGEENKGNYVLFLGKGISAFDDKTIDDLDEDDYTANMEEQLELPGIFSDNSPFVDFHLFAADYCSRDAYMGNMSYGDPESGSPEYHFGGSSLIWANIDAMLDDQNMAEADLIVFAGSDSVAEGLMHLVDPIVEYLQQKAPKAKIKFLIDTGWKVQGLDNYFADSTDGTKYSGPTESNSGGYEDTVYMRKWDGWRPTYLQACLDAYEEGDQWICGYTGNILYPHIVFQDVHIHFNQYDMVYAYGCAIPIDYSENWDEATTEFSDYLAESFVLSVLNTSEEVSFSAPTCRDSGTLAIQMAWDQEAMEEIWGEGIYTDLNYDIYYRYVMEDEVYRQYDDCGYVSCNPTCLDDQTLMANIGR